MLFQNPGYRFNDTVLHQQLRSQIGFTQLESFINEVGEDVASYLSTITNDVGELPIDLCEKYTDIYERLLHLMIQKPSLQFKEEVEVIQPQSTTRVLIDRKLKANINRASVIAAKVREMITASATHPQINYYSTSDQSFINSLIIKLRRSYPPSATTKDAAESIYSSVAKTGFGNCGEYAHCAYYLMAQSHSNIPADVYRVNRSDHVFLVIGRAQASDPGQPLSWGGAAVVCDAWAGLVYPVSEMNYYLSGYKCYKSRILKQLVNTTPSYNPRYHSVSKRFYPDDEASITRNHATLFQHRELKRTSDEYNKGKDQHASKRICVKKN